MNQDRREDSNGSLQPTGDQFRLLVDSVRDYAIFMLDPRGHVSTWNPGAERIKGYRREEIVGRHFSTFYPEEDVRRGKPEQELRTAAAEGRLEDEGWRLRKDGSRFWANVVISAMYDKSRRLIGFAKVTRDLTDRRRAEEEREQLLDQLRNLQVVTEAGLTHLKLDALLEQLLARLAMATRADTAAVLLLDRDGRHLEMHAAHGLETIDTHTRIAVDAEFVARLSEEAEVIGADDIQSGRAHNPLLRVPKVRSVLSAPLLVDGRPIGVLHVGTLSSRRFTGDDWRLLRTLADRIALAIERSRLYEAEREAREQLEQRVAERTAELKEINAELEAFAYTVSHDLRAPLRALNGLTQALVEDYGEQFDDTGQEYARLIAMSSKQMERLIEDLLAYSRLSRARLDRSAVALGAVMADALEGLDAVRAARGAEIVVEHPLPHVAAHRGTLQQVLTNLLSNAVKFVPAERRPMVRVRAETHADAVRLWIEDNGIGIAPEHQDRIFHVFERLHGVEAYEGTGVGLAIVRKGVERMGGRVGLDSTVGQGSRFWLELPRALQVAA